MGTGTVLPSPPPGWGTVWPLLLRGPRLGTGWAVAVSWTLTLTAQGGRQECTLRPGVGWEGVGPWTPHSWRAGWGESPHFGQRTQSLKVLAQLCHQGDTSPPKLVGREHEKHGGGGGRRGVTPVPAFPSGLQLCRARGGLAWRLLTRGCGCGCGQGAPQMGPPTRMQARPRPSPPRGAISLCPAGPAGMPDLQPPPPWRLQPEEGRSAPQTAPPAPGLQARPAPVAGGGTPAPASSSDP